MVPSMRKRALTLLNTSEMMQKGKKYLMVLTSRDVNFIRFFQNGVCFHLLVTLDFGKLLKILSDNTSGQHISSFSS